MLFVNLKDEASPNDSQVIISPTTELSIASPPPFSDLLDQPPGATGVGISLPYGVLVVHDNNTNTVPLNSSAEISNSFEGSAQSSQQTLASSISSPPPTTSPTDAPGFSSGFNPSSRDPISFFSPPIFREPKAQAPAQDDAVERPDSDLKSGGRQEPTSAAQPKVDELKPAPSVPVVVPSKSSAAQPESTSTVPTDSIDKFDKAKLLIDFLKKEKRSQSSRGTDETTPAAPAKADSGEPARPVEKPASGEGTLAELKADTEASTAAPPVDVPGKLSPPSPAQTPEPSQSAPVLTEKPEGGFFARALTSIQERISSSSFSDSSSSPSEALTATLASPAAQTVTYSTESPSQSASGEQQPAKAPAEAETSSEPVISSEGERPVMDTSDPAYERVGRGDPHVHAVEYLELSDVEAAPSRELLIVWTSGAGGAPAELADLLAFTARSQMLVFSRLSPLRSLLLRPLHHFAAAMAQLYREARNPSIVLHCS